MTDVIEILSGRVASGSIRPPGSKSITNRALVCAALANGQSTLSGVLASDDTHVMIDSLGKVGVPVESAEAPHSLLVKGCGGSFSSPQADLFIGNSGTTVRFLTAMLTVGTGQFRLDGVPRMRQRPIVDLVDALNALGAKVATENETGCPPVLVDAKGLPGGEVSIRGNISSQYLSGLLMAAPYAQEPVTVAIAGPLVSIPYVRMTCEVMRSFGVEVENQDDRRYVIPNTQGYEAISYAIEPDASAASYFWAAAAITGGTVRVEGLNRDALQGDVGFCRCLELMGCKVDYDNDGITVTGRELQGIDIDMNAISDTVQTLAAVALFANGPTRVTGVAHNRHKETDRITDLARELRKLGASVEEFEDGLTITPGEHRAADIDTYDDHRMAMSLSLPGLRIPGIRINDPGCTAKTYPHYFEDLFAILDW